jgi:excisionase family DNA binding protein
MEKWITVTEAADLIGVTHAYVIRLIGAGRIAAERFHGRAWLVDRRSAEHYRDNPPAMGRPRKEASSRTVVKKKATASPKKKQTVRKRTKP